MTRHHSREAVRDGFQDVANPFLKPGRRTLYHRQELLIRDVSIAELTGCCVVSHEPGKQRLLSRLTFRVGAGRHDDPPLGSETESRHAFEFIVDWRIELSIDNGADIKPSRSFVTFLRLKTRDRSASMFRTANTLSDEPRIGNEAKQLDRVSLNTPYHIGSSV